MINRCCVCDNPFAVPHHRGWYEYYVPRVCSSYCFTRLCNEGHPEVRIPQGDPRIEEFTDSLIDRRSNYEREFERYLRRLNLNSKYEPFRFRMLSGAGYVPDYLLSGRVFIEVKGLWTSEGKRKFLDFRDEFDNFPIYVVDRSFLDMLRRSTKP